MTFCDNPVIRRQKLGPVQIPFCQTQPRGGVAQFLSGAVVLGLCLIKCLLARGSGVLCGDASEALQICLRILHFGLYSADGRLSRL